MSLFTFGCVLISEIDFLKLTEKTNGASSWNFSQEWEISQNEVQMFKKKDTIMHNVIDPAANGKCGEEEGSEKTD